MNKWEQCKYYILSRRVHTEQQPCVVYVQIY